MGAPGGVACSKKTIEPSQRMFDHGLQSTRFREKVGCARNDRHRLFALKPCECLFIQLDNAVVCAADDQKRRGPNLIERLTSKVGATAARNDRTYPTFERCCSHNRCSSARARPKQADRKILRGRLILDPIHGVDEPSRKQENIEYIGPIELFVRGQEIEQQCRHAASVQRFRYGDIARTETTRSAAVRKDHKGTRRARYA